MQTNVPDHQRPRAIVIGLDCLQGLQAARVLASRRIPVIGIAKNPDYHSCRTRVCEKILYVNTANEKLIELLEELGPTFEAKPVLFTCQDKNVLMVSKHRDRLAQWYHFVLPEHEVIEMMIDKVLFYEWARENGFSIPQTFTLYGQADAERVATRLSYPCILKPRYRLSSWSKHTNLKAIIANDQEEFLALHKRLHAWADVLIVQELIVGGDLNHVTCNCYFDSRSEPLVTFTSRKLRQWTPQTGQASLSEEVRDDIVTEETVRLFRHAKFQGLGYLEMKRDERSGKYFIIEPNVGRPTGRSAVAEVAGVEYLYTMYADAVGLPLPENRQQAYAGVKWVHLLRDLQAAIYHWRRGELTARTWWRSFRGRKAYAVFSWRDPLPFISALYRALPAGLLSAKERRPNDKNLQLRDGRNDDRHSLFSGWSLRSQKTRVSENAYCCNHRNGRSRQNNDCPTT